MNAATNVAAEIRRLNGCIGDLTTILALPAMWIGSESSQIVTILLDALLRTLHLDFVYARLDGELDVSLREMARLGPRQNSSLQASDVGRFLERWLTRDLPVSPVVVANPAGLGTVTLACFRLGLQDDTGILVVGSARPDFPTKIEMLLLRVALNQAAIGLQESHLLGGQQRAAAELERQIAERTLQLTSANASLREEVSLWRRAQDESLVLKDELAEELTAMKRLDEFTTRLLTTTELSSALQEVLNESMALQNADFGNIQLLNSETGALEIVAQKGFQEDFLAHFKSVPEADSACGRALHQGRRVIVEDVLTDEAFAPHRQVAAAAGFRGVQATPLFNRNGEPLGMLSTHFRRPHRPSERELRLTDLYARHAAEQIERRSADQALRVSEGKYKTLFESIDEGFCTIEVLFDENEKAVDYRFLEVNPAFEKQTGIRDAQGQRMRDIAPHHEEYWFEIYGKIALTGEHARFENRAEQLHRWYDVYAFRIGDKRERKVAVLFKDITERKRAEEALRESEERFRRYFELGVVGMAITSPTKGCLEVNDELCSILGYEREELLRMTWAEMTHPDDLAADVAHFDRVLTGEIDGYSMDKRWIRKDGQIIDSIMAAKCVRRANGAVDYLVGLVQDITQRKRSDEALQAARDQLAHIGRVATMGELAASIAHEVNQPLTAVVTNGDAGLRWLSQSPPNVDEARKAMKEVVMQGHRASEVIARIRALLRKSKPNISTLDTKELIGEVLALTRQKVEEHGLAVKVQVAPDTPPVAGDAVQLQQVLVNLVLNGVEATNSGKNGARELLVTSQRKGINEVVIAVHDSGPGLDPENMDQLFRPFFTTKGTGLGMGLAISRSIVEAHGGRLWATSNNDRGATFQFSLPVHRAD